jgi:hypothetical protein
MANAKTTDAKTNATHTPPALIAWHVAERGEKKFWTRLGAAWNHEDGEGMTLQLDDAGRRRPYRSPRAETRGGGGCHAGPLNG